ncbi:MAG: toll/interleukin-1 receptor domain-containing protein [Candidatus Lokiarchaeota archaeon]|nr:toll/interleukin-1 receptor domain-containing protein [Candidatus Lokiarchaeota archaeon]
MVKRVKVFISHSAKDVKLVDNLVKFLEGFDIDAYIAERDYKIGRSLSQKIRQNIDTSDYFLVVYTINGKDSNFVNQEIGYWIDKKRDSDFIPFVEEGLNPGGFLSGVEYIQFNPLNPNLGHTSVEKYITQTTKMKEDQAFNNVIGGLGILAFIVLVGYGLYRLFKE